MNNFGNLSAARLAATLTVSAMFCSGCAAVGAQEVTNGGLSGQLMNLTATVPPQTTATLFSVPAGNEFVLTQACFTTGPGTNFRIHNVGGAGASSQVTLDNTTCQEYIPGVGFLGGDDVEFRNNAQAGAPTVRLLLNGILTTD